MITRKEMMQRLVDKFLELDPQKQPEFILEALKKVGDLDLFSMAYEYKVDIGMPR